MAPRIQRDPLLANTTRILRFEDRLALSASASADVLLDLFELQPLNTSNDVGGDPSESLLEQAEDINSRFGIDGSGQTVAVIDSGIAYDHVALGEGFGPSYRVVGGWDFAEGDANPYDDRPGGFHGTHVAGLLAGQTDSFQGIAPGADLVALRVFDDSGISDLDWIEDALNWVHENQFAFENPITTVNLSLGGTVPAEFEDEIQGKLGDELQLLAANGITVFAAAGNTFDASAPEQLAYPAASESVTAVGSIGGDGQLSSFSQRADGILVAPGESVSSAVPDHILGVDGNIDDFVASTGTSMASPQAAGAAILVRDALQTLGLPSDSDAVVSHLYATADPSTDPTTGIEYRTINLTRAIETLFVDADVDETESGQTTSESEPSEPVVVDSPVIDIGNVAHHSQATEANTWYQVRATQTGILSFAIGDAIQSDHTIVVQSEAGLTLGETQLSSQNQLDVDISAGDVIRFRLQSSSNDEIPLEIANLVSHSGSAVSFRGTTEGDELHLDLRAGALLRFGQFEYQFGEGTFDTIHLSGGGSTDSLTVQGSSAAERITLQSGHGTITNASAAITLDSFESVSVDGGGGPDRAYLYDSASNDTLSSRPGSAELEGAGYDHSVTTVDSIYVHGTAGGNDIAYLYDSAGDDELAIRPNFTSLRSDSHFNLVFGFDRVSAYGTAGGNDSANLYDSEGDDRLSANATSAFISGTGFYSQARGFESVTGHATAGGTDHATLYADSADQDIHRVGSLVQLDVGENSIRAARGFEINETFLGGIPIVVSPQSFLSPQFSDFAEILEPVSSELSDVDIEVIADIDEHLPAFQRDPSALANLFPIDDEDSETERGLLDQLFAEL